MLREDVLLDAFPPKLFIQYVSFKVKKENVFYVSVQVLRRQLLFQ